MAPPLGLQFDSTQSSTSDPSPFLPPPSPRSPKLLSRSDFPRDFIFGASTSAYQVFYCLIFYYVCIHPCMGYYICVHVCMYEFSKYSLFLSKFMYYICVMYACSCIYVCMYVNMDFCFVKSCPLRLNDRNFLLSLSHIFAPFSQYLHISHINYAYVYIATCFGKINYTVI